MWKDTFALVTKAGGMQNNIFWPGIYKEQEDVLLEQLLETAIATGVLSDHQVERFLTQVAVLHADHLCAADVARLGGDLQCDLHTAMIELLDMDGMLSPLSISLFGMDLLTEEDRQALFHDLMQPGPCRSC